MHAFLQNRKFAIFAKRTTGMAAGYFRGRDFLKWTFHVPNLEMINHMAETMKRSANEYGRAIGGASA